MPVAQSAGLADSPACRVVDADGLRGDRPAIILEGRLPDCYTHNSSLTTLSLGLPGQSKIEWKRGGRLSRFVVVPGSFTIVPAGEDNSFCMDRPLESLNLAFGTDQLRTLADREWEHYGLTIEIAPAYRQTVPEVVTPGQALADLVSSPRKGSGLYIETLWTQLAIQLLWNYSSLPDKPRLGWNVYPIPDSGA
jgi:hypothetical protein